MSQMRKHDSEALRLEIACLRRDRARLDHLEAMINADAAYWPVVIKVFSGVNTLRGAIDEAMEEQHAHDLGGEG